MPDLASELLGKATLNAIALHDTGLDTKLTYGDLKDRVRSAKAELTSAGLRKGDAVILAIPNSAWSVALILAITECGAVAVPINPDSTTEEMRFYIDDSEAALVIAPNEAERRFPTSSARVATLEPGGKLNLAGVSQIARQNDFEDGACVMIYTSGTTNKPKGVPLTSANVFASVSAFAKVFDLTDNDATLVPMPFFHVHGLIGATFSTLFSAGKAVLQSRFSASRFWRQVREHNITWYTASPTVHRILVACSANEQIPHGQLRFVRSSSASLGIDTIKSIEQQIGTVAIEGYGMTEAANQISCNPLPPGERKHGTVGFPAGTEVAIRSAEGRPALAFERGEIVIRGNSVMHGYHNRSEANATAFVDGWFRTGDEGFLDADGYLYVAGRIKELINRGGEKISPAEVEEVLTRHPLVADAACFGVPDTKYGEEVHAAVVLKTNTTEKDIKEFCETHLTKIKTPKTIHVVDRIPRTPTNKIMRAQLIASLGYPPCG